MKVVLVFLTVLLSLSAFADTQLITTCGVSLREDGEQLSGTTYLLQKDGQYEVLMTGAVNGERKQSITQEHVEVYEESVNHELLESIRKTPTEDLEAKSAELEGRLNDTESLFAIAMTMSRTARPEFLANADLAKLMKFDFDVSQVRSSRVYRFDLSPFRGLPSLLIEAKDQNGKVLGRFTMSMGVLPNRCN
jgi:hypothetical protein